MKKLLLEFLPLILFWSIYQLAKEFAPNPSNALYYATAAAIAGAVIQISWLWLRKQTISKTLWLSCGLIVMMGSITLILHNDTFIKLKPTLLNGTFALILALSPLWGKNFIRTLLGESLELPSKVWLQLNYVWAGFFAIMASINAYLTYNASNDTWIAFKTWGGIIGMLVFVVLQMVWLSRYIKADAILPNKEVS